MKRALTHSYRLFSKASKQNENVFEYIEQLRKSQQFDKALDTLAHFEKTHPHIAFKSSPFIRGQILKEKLASTGELDQIFKSPFLKTGMKLG